jgi:hypothetical protein
MGLRYLSILGQKKIRMWLIYIIKKTNFKINLPLIFHLLLFILAQSGASAALISSYNADITLEYGFRLISSGMTRAMFQQSVSTVVPVRTCC